MAISRKNKAKTNPIKANSKPIQSQFNPKQTQFKPKQTQLLQKPISALNLCDCFIRLFFDPDSGKMDICS